MEKQPNTARKWDEVDAVKAGRTLRRARQYAKKSQQDIADDMRVNLSVIEALENGDWRNLPGDTYAKGYMRRYAEIVGIDAPEAAAPSRTNEQEAVSHVKRLAMGLRETSLLMRRALVMVGIILSVALVTWSVLDETKQRVKLEIVKPVPQRLKDLLIEAKAPEPETMGPPKRVEEKPFVEREPEVKREIKTEVMAEPRIEMTPPARKPVAIIEKPKATHPKELPRINIKPKAVKAADDAFSPPPRTTKPTPSALDTLVQNTED